MRNKNPCYLIFTYVCIPFRFYAFISSEAPKKQKHQIKMTIFIYLFMYLFNHFFICSGTKVYSELMRSHWCIFWGTESSMTPKNIILKC